MPLNADILKESLFQAMAPAGAMSEDEQASLRNYTGKIATAIINHFIQYGEVNFSPGSINGGCPGGSGGPLIGGQGNAGKIF